MFKKAILGSLPLFLSVLIVPVIVLAASFVENFDPPLKFKQPGDQQRPGLWLINDGDFHQGSFQYYKRCGDSSCINREEEEINHVTNNFLRTTMYHDETPGNYVNMEASELQTGYVFGQGYEDAHPTPGNPVTLTARMRCSRCNFGGSGEQIGSWGLWLWNSYPEIQPDGTFGGNNPVNSIGFAWAQNGGVLPGGLNIAVFKDNIPVYFVPLAFTVSPIDLTQWHTYSFTWSTDALGTETVTYFIDGNQVGFTTIPGGMVPLSETIWHDNQLVTGFDQNGKPISVFLNPAVPQSVDVDFVSVSQ